MSWKHTLWVGVSAGVLSALSFPSVAQDVAAETGVITLESLTVTARKIAETESEIPVAMTTIGEADIVDARVERMEDIARLAPGFNFSKGAQSRYSIFNIRGVGSLVPGGFEDGSVSAYVDGVPVPLSLMDGVYGDLERIEVLRGPQGTLYGKNAQAGAINITTRAPGERLEGEVGTDIGTNGRREVSALLGGPVVRDRLALRLALKGSTEDGLVHNDALGRESGGLDRVTGRGTVDARWTDRFDTRLSVTREIVNNNDNQMVPANLYDRTNEPFDAYNDQRIWSGGMTNTVRLVEGLDLKLITGATSIDGREHFVQSIASHSLTDYDEKQVSQEVRLDGTQGGRTWSVGMFYNRFAQNQTMEAMGMMSLVDTGRHRSDTRAVFGEVTQPLTGTLKLTTGLRLQRTHVTTEENVVHRTFGFTHGYADSQTFTGWNGRVALTFLPSDTDTFFASVARSYKPGGFQTAHSTAIGGVPAPTVGYDSATTLTYEAGYKGQFLDRRLSFDATAYLSKTKDEQVVGYDPVTFSSRYSNIDAASYGLELASRVKVTREMTVGGALSLTRAYATEDGDLGWNGRVREGAGLPMTPAVSYNLFADWHDSVGFGPAGMAWFARVDYAFTGARWGELTHANRLDSYGILDLSLGVEADRFRVAGYVDNALDDRYLDFSAFGRSRPGVPRRFGVRGSVSF